MNAAKPLLHAVGIPGQVVIDHEVGVLQVHAFASGIGGQQYHHIGVVAKGFLHLAPVIAVDAAVDGDHGLFAAQRVAHAHQQVIERIPVLCEYDDLSAATIGGEHFRLVLQQPRKFFPFAVGTGLHHLGSLILQVTQDDDFCAQFWNGFSRCGLVNHLVGQHFVFVGTEFVGSFIQVFRHVHLAFDNVLTQVLAQHIGTGFELKFVKSRFEFFTAAAE